MTNTKDEDSDDSGLEEYQCHKRVHAEPMTLGGYRKLYDDNDYQMLANTYGIGKDDEEGYRVVVYSKGRANQYISWSPKEEFDNGYAKVSDPRSPEAIRFSRFIKECEDMRSTGIG